MNNAEVIVVLPSLGEREDLFKQSLESIDLQRQNVSLNLVVVLPENAKKARQLADEFGAHIVDDPGRGLSAAINAGLSVSSGEKYYAWMGDDDLFEEGALRFLVDQISRSKNAVLAFGACRYISSSGAQIGVNNAGGFAKVLLSWGPDLIPHPGSLMLLDAVNKAGNYDESLKYCMDLDLFLRLKSLGKFVSSRKIVSSFRWHPESLTVAGRQNSSLESEGVKYKYLPRVIQPFSFIWNVPIRYAAKFASINVNEKAKSLDKLAN